MVGLVFAAPFAYLVYRTASLGGDLWSELAAARTWRALRNSLLLGGAAATIAAVLGTALAWITTRTDLPARRAWGVAVTLPLVIPSFVAAAALREALGPGGVVTEVFGWRVPRLDGFWGALIVIVLVTYPYVYLPVAARLGGLPRSLEEGARLLGSRPLTVFQRVVLPQIWDAILAGSLLVFLYAISDFGAVALMRFNTLTRAIFANRLFDQGSALTLSLLLGVLAISVAAGEQALARRRRSMAVVRGASSLVVPLGRWRPAAYVLLLSVAGIALAAPTAVFTYWWIRGSTTVGASYDGLVDSLAGLVGPAVNTAVAGVLAAVAATVVVLPVAFAVARPRDRVGALAATLVVGAFALPGLVIALGLVYWALRAPLGIVLYQTMPLLVFAYVVNFGAQSMQATRGAVRALPARLGEAARVLGAGRLRRLRTVELPLVLPGLLAGAGLVMLSTMKELPATLLLAPTGFTTLATRIWGAAEDGFLAEVGITSLALIGLSASMTWLLLFRRRPQQGG